MILHNHDITALATIACSTDCQGPRVYFSYDRAYCEGRQSVNTLSTADVNHEIA